jgi:hypothetical protein
VWVPAAEVAGEKAVALRLGWKGTGRGPACDNGCSTPAGGLMKLAALALFALLFVVQERVG